MKWFVLMVLSFLFTTQAFSYEDRAAFKLNFCVCKDELPVSYGNCASFCSDKVTNGSEILFAQFSFAANRYFKNTKQWCSKGPFNRKCTLKAVDENGNMTFLDVKHSGKNSIQVNVESLHVDKVYVLQMIEESSGAKTDMVQLLKFH